MRISKFIAVAATGAAAGALLFSAFATPAANGQAASYNLSAAAVNNAGTVTVTLAVTGPPLPDMFQSVQWQLGYDPAAVSYVSGVGNCPSGSLAGGPTNQGGTPVATVLAGCVAFGGDDIAASAASATITFSCIGGTANFTIVNATGASPDSNVQKTTGLQATTVSPTSTVQCSGAAPTATSTALPGATSTTAPATQQSGPPPTVIVTATHTPTITPIPVSTSTPGGAATAAPGGGGGPGGGAGGGGVGGKTPAGGTGPGGIVPPSTGTGDSQSGGSMMTWLLLALGAAGVMSLGAGYGILRRAKR